MLEGTYYCTVPAEHCVFTTSKGNIKLLKGQEKFIRVFPYLLSICPEGFHLLSPSILTLQQVQDQFPETLL